MALGGFLPPVVAELVAKTGQFSSEMGKARAEMSQTSSHGQKAFSGLAAVGKAALIGIGGSAIAVGGFALHMADQYQIAHARLEQAFKSTGSTLDEYRSQVAAAVKQGEKFGQNATQVQDALAIMVRGMGDGYKATQNLGLAQDLAAAKGIDLSSAALAVTKASEGQLKPIKALGIDLPIAAAGAVKLEKAHSSLAKAQDAQHIVQEKIAAGLLKGLPAYLALANAQQKVSDAQHKVNSTASAGTDILDALGKKIGGSAALQSETFAGKMKALRAEVDNMGIKIGMWLIPKIQQLIDITGKVIGWFEKHKAVAIVLGVAIGTVLVAAIAAYIASLIAAAAAQLVALGPIILIVAAVAAVGVAIYELATHWKTVWDWIKNAVSVAWSFITNAVSIGYHAVLDFFKRLPGEALGVLKNLPHLLSNLGHLAIAGLLLGAKAAFITALAFFVGIPLLIIAVFVRSNVWLYRHGGEIIHGLWLGAQFIFKAALFWFVGIPLLILGALPGAASWLLQKGKDVIGGLWRGAKAMFVNVALWFVSLPALILNAVTGLPDALVEAGKAVITGFLNGLKAAWHTVTGWISDALSHLPQIVKKVFHISSPSKVFHDLGLNTMQGFHNGLKAGWGDIERTVAGMSAHIGGVSMGGLGMSGFRTASAGNTVIHVDLRGSVGVDGPAVGQWLEDQLHRHGERNGGVKVRIRD